MPKSCFANFQKSFFSQEFTWLLTVSPSLFTKSRKMCASFNKKCFQRRVVMSLPPIHSPDCKQQFLYTSCARKASRLLDKWQKVASWGLKKSFFGQEFTWLLTVSPSLFTKSRKMCVSFNKKCFRSLVIMSLPPIDSPDCKQQFLYTSCGRKTSRLLGKCQKVCFANFEKSFFWSRIYLTFDCLPFIFHKIKKNVRFLQ